MASKDITILDNASNVPSYMKAAVSAADDLSGGLSGGFGVISFKGKTWAVSQGGQRTLIMRPDDPEETASSIEVVILAGNPNLSKIYYSGGFVEGADAKPTCYSNNGDHPEADAQVPQSLSCQTCEHNMWGSRKTDNGGKGKACSDSRRLAVAAVGELDNPLLLRVPAASLKDLAAFNSQVKKLNAPYHAVVCKIGFDSEVAHPQLKFKALRWLTEEEYKQSEETRTGDLVQQIIASAKTIGADTIGTPAATQSTPQENQKDDTPPSPKTKAKANENVKIADDKDLDSELAAALEALND